MHEKKTTETYSTFSGRLRTLEPELRDVIAFGTDDEEALIQGFRNNFDRSVYLLCELHLKKNVEKKLQDMGIVGEAKATIVADIFGKLTGKVKESGLTEAQDQDKFQYMLHNLKEKLLIASSKAVNDLPNCLNYAMPRMFADDTSVSYAADSKMA